mgnify:CR=1 FL=1
MTKENTDPASDKHFIEGYLKNNFFHTRDHAVHDNIGKLTYGAGSANTGWAADQSENILIIGGVCMRLYLGKYSRPITLELLKDFIKNEALGAGLDLSDAKIISFLKVYLWKLSENRWRTEVQNNYIVDKNGKVRSRAGQRYKNQRRDKEYLTQ